MVMWCYLYARPCSGLIILASYFCHVALFIAAHVQSDILFIFLYRNGVAGIRCFDALHVL